MRNELLQQTNLFLLDWVGPLPLNEDELSRVPEGIPGVYLLHVLARCFGGYVTFYAGRSSNLRRRLQQHLCKRTTKLSIRAVQEIDCAFWSAAPVENPSLLACIESGLIRNLIPICNDQIPGQKPVIVNLPPLFLLDAFSEET